MNKFDSIQSKILSLNDLQRLIKVWRLKSSKIVFTNGCFDILHRGHATYLAKAAEYGNKLIVAVNSDASVRRQDKGDDRPVNDETSRALLIASLQVVDAVVVFDQDTPLELIQLLQPDVLVKGGDYDASETNPTSKKYIVGSDGVRANGGEIVTIPFVDGFSTTSTIAKLKG
ncbi:MAG: adenylyltransferase/cytidyltransferase family protein [Flavobacteriales bacterium]